MSPRLQTGLSFTPACLAVGILTLLSCGSPSSSKMTQPSSSPDVPSQAKSSHIPAKSPPPPTEVSERPSAGSPDEPVPAPAPRVEKEPEPVPTPPTEDKPATPTDPKILAAEFNKTLENWVRALDDENRDGVFSILLGEEDLRKILPEAHLKIVQSHVGPKNVRVLKTLLNSMERQNVELVQVQTSDLLVPGKDAANLSKPTVINSVVEIAINELPVSLELRRAYRTAKGWKVLEVVIRH